MRESRRRRFANNATVSDQRHPGGLSSQEAAKRLRKLGPVEDRTSRSVASIVAGNVFTFFNLIIGVFFVVMLALGLFADALFGFIAVINSYIGIRQELKAKETLESLALLVAPKAKAVRDGELVELRAEEIVPGDWIRVEPGDQLVADGEVTESRGLTLDESMLTGEADGVRKRVGQRALSGSFCITGSGYYEVDAVREDSYAEKVAGEARTFRHPPSPLQDEVNLVLKASTWLMIPLAVVLIFALQARNTPLHEAAQTATAGPDHPDPRGPRPADERHARRRRRPARPARHPRAADERDRGARGGRHDLRRQDRDADHRASSSWSRSTSPTPRRRAGPSRPWPASRPARASATGPWRRSPRTTRRAASGSGPRSPSRRSGSGAG